MPADARTCCNMRIQAVLILVTIQITGITMSVLYNLYLTSFLESHDNHFLVLLASFNTSSINTLSDPLMKSVKCLLCSIQLILNYRSILLEKTTIFTVQPKQSSEFRVGYKYLLHDYK